MHPLKNEKIPSSLLKHFSIRNDLLWFDEERVCVPKNMRTEVIHDHHDIPISGHQGIERTYSSLQRFFYWPRMIKDITKYINSCDACQRNKTSQKVPAGLLQPLPIPTERWSHISMDFITQLPITKDKHDAIVVFVDLLTKMVHFVPTFTNASAPSTARLFFDNVFRLHGLPRAIVSDRDSKFTSKFWRALFEHLGTKLNMSTSFHPQTDGQTERANRTLEDMLRAFVSYEQTDWDKYLAAAEFASNNAPNASTGMSPFKMNYGFDPAVPSTLLLPPSDAVPAFTEFLVRMQNLTKVA